MAQTFAVRLVSAPPAIWLTCPHHVADQPISGIARESYVAAKTHFTADVISVVAVVAKLVPTVQQALWLWACNPSTDRYVGGIPLPIVTTSYRHLCYVGASASTSSIRGP
jgi:hypothetical protein